MTRFISNSDPGLNAVAFDEWCNPTTGTVYVRNLSNTKWNIVGNVNVDNLGLSPTDGHASTGMITGNTGWITVDSPEITTSATLDGNNIITTTDVSEFYESYYNSIDRKILYWALYATKDRTITDNIAVKSGVLSFPDNATVAQEIPLPEFQDGSKPDESNCKWIVSGLNLVFPDNHVAPAGGGYFLWYASETPLEDHQVDPTTTRTFIATILGSTGNGYSRTGVDIAYLIIGTR